MEGLVVLCAQIVSWSVSLNVKTALPPQFIGWGLVKQPVRISAVRAAVYDYFGVLGLGIGLWSSVFLEPYTSGFPAPLWTTMP